MQHVTQETRKRGCLGDLWDGSRFKFGKMRRVQPVLAWVDALVGRLPLPPLHGTLQYIPCSTLSCRTSVRRGVCSATAEKNNAGIGTLTRWVALGSMARDGMEKMFKQVFAPYVLSPCPLKYTLHNILLHSQQTQWDDNICNLLTLLSSLRLIMVASNTALFLQTEEQFKPFGKDLPKPACGGAATETI